MTRAYRAITAQQFLALASRALVESGKLYPVTHYEAGEQLAQVMIGSTAFILPLSREEYAQLPEVTMHLGDDTY